MDNKSSHEIIQPHAILHFDESGFTGNNLLHKQQKYSAMHL